MLLQEGEEARHMSSRNGRHNVYEDILGKKTMWQGTVERQQRYPRANKTVRARAATRRAQVFGSGKPLRASVRVTGKM